PRFRSMVKRWTWPVQQAGSSKSVSPLPSLSMQSPQISTAGAVQLSRGVCVQAPAVQRSCVQASWSSQSAVVRQGVQPGIGPLWQTPAPQNSVVQAFWSSQSAAVVQGLQPARAVLWQTPASQESVVQAFWSSQSAAVEQSVQPARAVPAHCPLPSQTSLKVQALPSSHGVLAGWKVSGGQ